MNLKAISILLIAGIAVFDLGCVRSPQAKEAKFLDNGKKFLEKGDFARAALEFRSAMGAMQRDAEPYYQMGLADFGRRDLQAAVNDYNKALQLNPKHAQARLKLAEIMAMHVDSKVLADAEKRLEDLLQDSGDSAEALNTLALTELKLGKSDDAIQSLERALRSSPRNLRAAVLLSVTKMRAGDRQGAEAVMIKAVESAPDSADPKVVLGEFYSFQGRLPEAEKQFTLALNNNPKSGPALLDLALLQRSMGRKPEAEASFKRLAGFGEGDYKSAYAIYLFEDGRRDEAVRELERLAKQDPNDRATRTRLVVAYQKVGRKQDAEAVLSAVLKKNPRDGDALLQRSEILISSGAYTQADADINEVLRLRPASSEGHYVRAKLHGARGERLIYRQELIETLRLNPYLLAVRLELAQYYINNKEAKEAIAVLDETPDRQKQSIAVLVQRNWALWSLNDYAGMRMGIDQGLLVQKTADLLIQDGLWKLHAGQYPQARASIEQALKINPENLQALAALRRTYVDQKQGGVAVQKIQEYVQQNPHSAQLQSFYGLVLLNNNRRDEARAAFEEAKKADPKSAQSDLYLVQLDVFDGKMNEAETKLKQLLTTNSAVPMARLWLGDIEVTKGNYAAAVDYFRKTLEVSPDNAAALNNLAYLTADYVKKPDEALKYAERAHELAPNDPDYDDTLGWILYLKGLYGLSVKHLEVAAAREDNVVWKYHLAMAYSKTGDPRAKSVLKVALQRDPNVPEAKVAMGMIGGK